MANAVIGALRVNLGLDSAQFSAGLKKAQVGLDRFGKVAAVGFAAAATAAVAAGAALAVAGKHAIDAADNMSKAAQKVGVATAALSRLNYAAGYSDVTLEQLTGGLQKLSKNLADVASGQGAQAAVALQALGISATEAGGKLRSSDEVFTDIADRFGRMEDGSTKTALALQLFGRAGAEMIPLLNSGKDGLKAMADESDRLGLTISGKTGRAAEEFNDTLTKVQRILDGVAMKVAEAALPALQQLADVVASPAFATAMQDFAVSVINAMNDIAPYVMNAANNLRMLRDLLVDAASRSTEGIKGTVTELKNEVTTLENRIGANKDRLATGDDLFGINRGAIEGQIAKDIAAVQPLIDKIAELQRVVAGREAVPGATEAPAGAAPGDMGGGFSLPTFGDNGGSDAMAGRLEALRQSLMSEEQLEIDSHAKRLEEIASFYEREAIGKAERDSMIEAAEKAHGDRMSALVEEEEEKKAAIREAGLRNVAGIFGSLATITENMGEKSLAATKAFGVAEAVVNTAVGITKAFEQQGPLGFLGAAAVAAAGAAQISTILSTNKGGGSKPSVGGAAGEVPAATASPARSVSIALQGETFSRDAVVGLFHRLNDELGIDGLELVPTHRQA